MRRQLWADTSVDGEPLEYTGKGSELLVGFIIATFTVAIPLAGILLGVQLMASSPAILAGVILFIYLMLFLLIGAAVFLARRYQMSRTLWRGVRFSQEGSPLGYGAATLGYILLSAITLGWFSPVMRLRLARMMWREARYGDLKFTWREDETDPKEPVWTSFAHSWAGGLFPLLAFLGAVAVIGEDIAAANPAAVAGLYVVVLLSFVPSLLLGAWHDAVMQRRITRCIRIGEVRLSSDISAGDMLRVIFGNIGLMIVSLGFGGMAAQMRIWRLSARRMRAEGEADYAAISQAASRGPGSGEGMADAFDLGGGF